MGFYISAYIDSKHDLITLYNKCPGFISVAVTETQVKSNLGEKRVTSPYNSGPQPFIVKTGAQCWILKADLLAIL